jgi:hypothetical protein
MSCELPEPARVVPDGTYTGAVAMMRVSDGTITYVERDNETNNIVFDWNGKPGVFTAPSGKMIVEYRPSASDENVMLTLITFRPRTRPAGFPCVSETMFWFYDGVYDGDDNGIDCSGGTSDDASRIVARYIC